MNAQLAHERVTVGFPVRQLSYEIYGKKRFYQIEKLRKLIEEDPIFDNQGIWHKNQVERYNNALKMTARILQICNEKNLSFEYIYSNHSLIINLHILNNSLEDRTLLFNLCSETLPTTLHEVGFVPYIESQ